MKDSRKNKIKIGHVQPTPLAQPLDSPNDSIKSRAERSDALILDERAQLGEDFSMRKDDANRAPNQLRETHLKIKRKKEREKSITSGRGGCQYQR